VARCSASRSACRSPPSAEVPALSNRVPPSRAGAAGFDRRARYRAVAGAGGAHRPVLAAVHARHARALPASHLWAERMLGLCGGLPTLIGVGNGICGASAIAAATAVIGAAEVDVAPYTS